MTCDLVTIHSEDFGNQVEATGISFRNVKCNYSEQDLTHNWVWTCKPWEIGHMQHQHQLSQHSTLPAGKISSFTGWSQSHEMFLVKPFIETLPFWDELWVLFPCHAFINFQDNPLSNRGTKGGGKSRSRTLALDKISLQGIWLIFTQTLLKGSQRAEEGSKQTSTFPESWCNKSSLH